MPQDREPAMPPRGHGPSPLSSRANRHPTLKLASGDGEVTASAFADAEGERDRDRDVAGEGEGGREGGRER